MLYIVLLAALCAPAWSFNAGFPLIMNAVEDPSLCKSLYFHGADDNECQYQQCALDQDGEWISYTRFCMAPLVWNDVDCSCEWPDADSPPPSGCHENYLTPPPCVGEEGLSCCQPGVTQEDHTAGWGWPYTLIEGSIFEYCGEILACPWNGTFDLETCGCEVVNTTACDCEFWDFNEQLAETSDEDAGENPFADIFQSTPIIPGNATIVNSGGLDNSPYAQFVDTDFPGSIPSFSKAWFGALTFAFFVKAGDTGVITNGDLDEGGNVKPTITITVNANSIDVELWDPVTDDTYSFSGTAVGNKDGFNGYGFFVEKETSNALTKQAGAYGGEPININNAFIVRGSKCALKFKLNAGIDNLAICTFTWDSEAAGVYFGGGETPDNPHALP